MRMLRLLTLVALSITALAAKKAPAAPSTFDKYLAKQRLGPIEIDERVYDELTAGPRDYSVGVLFTARPAKYACQICKDFDPEWDIVARSWTKGDPTGQSRLLLVTLDFEHGRNVFLKHQLSTAPILFFFPPTAGPNAKADNEPRRFEFVGPQSAESVRNWLVRHLPEGGDYPQIQRPINYTRIVTIVTIIVGLFTVGTVAYPYNQIGIETQIVAAMYAILAFATISLSLKAPRIKDQRTQQLAVIIWGSVLWGMYSFLMSVFRIKNGGYPFWLPPF
ncbi:hypothetical protein DV736_g742, partial [Chaetothyriales sp. CBS 134916]